MTNFCGPINAFSLEKNKQTVKTCILQLENTTTLQ